MKLKTNEEMTMEKVPNGAIAILDDHGRIIAYNRHGEPTTNKWDYVRKDYILN